jgi:hypothetical protein
VVSTSTSVRRSQPTACHRLPARPARKASVRKIGASEVATRKSFGARLSICKFDLTRLSGKCDPKILRHYCDHCRRRRARSERIDNLARWIDQAFEIQGYSEAKTLGAASQELGTPVQVLDRLGNRFHLVAEQLRALHGGRETLKIMMSMTSRNYSTHYFVSSLSMCDRESASRAMPANGSRSMIQNSTHLNCHEIFFERKPAAQTWPRKHRRVS